MPGAPLLAGHGTRGYRGGPPRLSLSSARRRSGPAAAQPLWSGGAEPQHSPAPPAPGLPRPRSAARPRAAPAPRGPSLRRDGSTGAGCPALSAAELSAGGRAGGERAASRARPTRGGCLPAGRRTAQGQRCGSSPGGRRGGGAGGGGLGLPAAGSRRPGAPPGFAAGRSPATGRPGLGSCPPPPAARFLLAWRWAAPGPLPGVCGGGGGGSGRWGARRVPVCPSLPSPFAFLGGRGLPCVAGMKLPAPGGWPREGVWLCCLLGDAFLFALLFWGLWRTLRRPLQSAWLEDLGPWQRFLQVGWRGDWGSPASGIWRPTSSQLFWRAR